MNQRSTSPLPNAPEAALPPDADPALDELLAHRLERALRRSRVRGGAIHLRDYGSVVGLRDGEDLALERSDERGAGSLLRALSRRRTAKVVDLGSRDGAAVSSKPILYRGEALGNVEWLGGNVASETTGEDLAAFARDVALHVQRHLVARRVRHCLGLDLRLIGESAALQILEEDIECTTRSRLPVIVEGELGLEQLLVACSIHFAGPRARGPFVEVKCGAHRRHADARPEEWFDRAYGGTLFFNGIERLDISLQRRLPMVLVSQVGQWLSSVPAGDTPGVRVVASARDGVDDRVEDGELSRALFAELSFLRIRIPPLRQRREDVRPLVEHYLNRHRQHVEQCLSEATLQALEQHDWPGNLFELERVVARLAAMSGPGVIGLTELSRHAPEVRVASAVDKTAGVPAAVAAKARQPHSEAATVGMEALSDEEVTLRLVTGELEVFESLHPGLRSALRHIAEHYDESIAMADLARASYVSASHLSFLFRTVLGTSFKALLAAVRVERAKQLLVAEPEQRITDVCLEVGFGDLSHFEKTFKRRVLLNPRAFRRLALEGRGRDVDSYL